VYGLFLRCSGNIHLLGEFISPGTRKKTFHHRLHGTAHIAGAAGSTQTVQITWSSSCPGGTNTNDDWYGTTAAIRTAAAASATAPAAPTNLTAIVQ